ncbi:MAG: hypothetical protein K8R23_08500 [Chthoniobacter sp.]|nr:hypothetical protein [Chthoniobacter sp.]
MPNLDLNSEQRERLRYLAHVALWDLSAFGTTQGRQVIMLGALVEGIEGKWIASQFGVGPSMVSNFKKKIAKEGVESLLQEWELTVKRHKEDMDDFSGKSEGIESIDAWLESQSAEREPAIEIATLVVGPGANIAIFAVRDRKRELLETMKPFRSFPATVRAIFAGPIIENPPWTRISVFDAHCSALLKHLTAKYPTLERPPWRAEIADPLPQLHHDYGPDYEFFIIAQGDVAERNVERWRQLAKARGEALPDGNILRPANGADFFCALRNDPLPS